MCLVCVVQWWPLGADNTHSELYNLPLLEAAIECASGIGDDDIRSGLVRPLCLLSVARPYTGYSPVWLCHPHQLVSVWSKTLCPVLSILAERLSHEARDDESAAAAAPAGYGVLLRGFVSPLVVTCSRLSHHAVHRELSCSMSQDELFVHRGWVARLLACASHVLRVRECYTSSLARSKSACTVCSA